MKGRLKGPIKEDIVSTASSEDGLVLLGEDHATDPAFMAFWRPPRDRLGTAREHPGSPKDPKGPLRDPQGPPYIAPSCTDVHIYVYV